MKTCKTCSSEFEGNFCNTCGQRYIEKQTFQFALDQLLDVIDVRKGFFKTSYYLLFKPQKLVSDYLNGKTRDYIHPVGYLLIVSGFFYLLDESEVLGFKGIGMYLSQFSLLSMFISMILLSSFLVGIIKVIRYTSIEILIINLYQATALSVFTFLMDIYGHFESIYQWEERVGRFPPISLIVIFLFWLLRYQWVVFKPKVWVAFVNLMSIAAGMALLAFVTSLFSDDSSSVQEPKLSGLERRYWVFQREEKLKVDFESAYPGIANPLYTDLTGNGLDECAILLQDSTKTPILALFKVDEEAPQVIHFQDYKLKGEVLSWEAVDQKVFIEFGDGLYAEIYWDKTSFRVKSSFPK